MTKERRRQYGSGSVSQRSSDGRWVGAIMAGYNTDGKRRRVTVTGKTEAEVKRKLERKKAEIAKSGVPAAGGRASIKSWSEQWLTIMQTKVRPKTWINHRTAVRVWIVPTIGHRRLDTLTRGDIRAVLNDARSKGHIPAGRRAHAVMIKMLHDAVAEGHHIPMAALTEEAPKPPDTNRGAIPVPDVTALMRVADGMIDGSRWYMALHTGARQGECLGLTWDRVDFTRRTVDISWQLQSLPYVTGRSGALRVPDDYEYRRLHGAVCLVRPKSRKSKRVVPMSPGLETALLSWRDLAWTSTHDLVWTRGPGDDRGRVASDDRADWYALQDLADVHRPDGTHYQLHELRHTAATVMQNNGVPLEVIRLILGHSVAATTAEYAHADRSLTEAAVIKLDAAVSRRPG